MWFAVSHGDRPFATKQRCCQRKRTSDVTVANQLPLWRQLPSICSNVTMVLDKSPHQMLQAESQRFRHQNGDGPRCSVQKAGQSCNVSWRRLSLCHLLTHSLFQCSQWKSALHVYVYTNWIKLNHPFEQNTIRYRMNHYISPRKIISNHDFWWFVCKPCTLAPSAKSSGAVSRVLKIMISNAVWSHQETFSTCFNMFQPPGHVWPVDNWHCVQRAEVLPHCLGKDLGPQVGGSPPITQEHSDISWYLEQPPMFRLCRIMYAF